MFLVHLQDYGNERNPNCCPRRIIMKAAGEHGVERRQTSNDFASIHHDFLMTFEDIRRSAMISGPPNRPNWDRAWRILLVNNLELVARQLWQVGIDEIYLGGSFIEDKDHPEDIDGYFVCDRDHFKSRRLHDALNALDPWKVWTWRDEHRLPDETGILRLPMWHRYRVELFPYYGQTGTGYTDDQGRDIDFPNLFRRVKDIHQRKQIIKLIRPRISSPIDAVDEILASYEP
jgi:hypothetical protein